MWDQGIFKISWEVKVLSSKITIKDKGHFLTERITILKLTLIVQAEIEQNDIDHNASKKLNLIQIREHADPNPNANELIQKEILKLIPK